MSAAGADAPGRGGYLSILERLRPEERPILSRSFGFGEAWAVDGDWASWAHAGQLPPEGDWRTWVLMAGRGFGKTLAGSNWITACIARAEKDRAGAAGGAGSARARASRPLRIALVGATLEDARRVMVEGPSGLLEVAGDWVTDWNPSLRRIAFRTGAEATLFSGASPAMLRGPEHHFAWCDELAKWEKPLETWQMLQLGLRADDRARALITTTPGAGRVLQAIIDEPCTILTGGPTSANPHVSPAWRHAVEALYAGTRLGRQELEGELITDTPGALWSVELLERCRLVPPHAERGEGNHAKHGGGVTPAPSTTWRRAVIGVDPPAADGTCGIVACAKDREGRAHVLADHSVTAVSPDNWARAVAGAARLHSSSSPSEDGEGNHAQHGGGVNASIPVLIVAEKNQGGRMVETILRNADPSLRVKSVTATVGKSERAAPVAQLFEAGRVVLHGRFPELEAEMCGMIAGGGYEGPGGSPDRADAMVWAVTELMLAPERAPPRVRTL